MTSYSIRCMKGWTSVMSNSICSLIASSSGHTRTNKPRSVTCDTGTSWGSEPSELKLWQISSKWASFALNSVLGKGIYGSALQSLLSSTVSIFFEFLFLGILSDLHLTFWVFNIVNLRTSSDKQSLSSIVPTVVVHYWKIHIDFFALASFLRHLDMSLISGLHNICHWKRKKKK